MNIVANLGAEQRAAYQKLENTNSNYFITGKAGTGKSVLLSYFVAHTKKNIAVVAPTGVAAINVGGFTIHSFFQLEPTFQDCLDKKKVRDINDKQANIISELDAIVIDEISMVSADLLDMIDAKLRFIKKQREEPFGGCQIIMFGDPFQLPPIPPRGDALKLMEARYNSTFFFSSLVMADLPFETIELNHIYRQTDDEFIRILNKIRVGDIDFEMINSLNKRCLHEDSDDTVITLASTNRISDQINELNLDMLPGQIYNFHANIVGDIKRSDYPAPDALSLREGAHVMMLKNDRPDTDSLEYNPRWVNGTLATVSDVDSSKISVVIGKKKHDVDREDWDKYRLVGRHDEKTGRYQLVKESIGTFTQYPMRLAYAITIHKSQGQTYDRIRIDLGRGAFAYGQTYVALSRGRSLDGTSFAHPIRPSDIRVDPRVIKFMNRNKT